MSESVRFAAHGISSNSERIKITIFENLDNIVMLLGYVLTAINKRKIEFDSNGAILGELKQ